MTTATKNKPVALFTGKGAAMRSTALATIAALSFSEELSREACINAARKALGKSPTEAQTAAARLEYVIGRVAARLPVSELIRGKVTESDRLERARDLILHYATPVKADGKAYKLRKGKKGYRTEMQHRIIRAAEEAASRFMADVGVGTAKASQERNTAKKAKATRAPSMAGSGKGKASAPTAPTHQELVKPAAPTTVDDVLTFLNRLAQTAQDFANKHARLCPIDAGTAVQAFRGDMLKAMNAHQERKAIAAAADKGDAPNVTPIAKARRAKAKA